MEIKLKNLLRGYLIIPYPDEVIEELESVCSTYALEHNTHNDVADLTISMIRNEWDGDFQTAIESLYDKQNEKDIKLPKCTLRAFAAYVLLLILNDADHSKGNCLAFMNSILVANENYSQIPFPELFTGYLKVFDEYYSTKTLRSTTEINNTGTIIFKSGEDHSLLSFSASELNGEEDALRVMAKESWLFRISKFSNSAEMKACSNGYEKAVVFITFITENMPWAFVNSPIEELLDWSGISQRCKVESISSIKRIISECDIPQWDSNSSILLRLLDDDINYPKLIESKLSAREFAIHLYYELLLEKIFV